MIKREIEPKLLSLSKRYPVVTITGPRQSGKTTLAQRLFPDRKYFNLEELDTRQLAIEDPRGFLSEFSEGGIIDEIQHAPQLLSYIQADVDKHQQMGRYILIGSHQLELQQAVSQSLAGRTALLTLLPLSLQELIPLNLNMDMDDYLVTGFFPRIYKDHLDPTKAYRNYLQTYVERDIRRLTHIKDLIAFQRFLKLCAGRIGQPLNITSLCNDVGISAPTIKHWLALLEASFIIFRLQPYFENFGKRVIKSPKLYFTDVGLASYLLDIESIDQVKRDPLKGSLVENLVISELVKSRLNSGLDPHLYYYRDSHHNEVDVVFKTGDQLIPIEIKASKTFTTGFLKGLNFFQEAVGDRCKSGFVIYGGEKSQAIHQWNLLPYTNASAALRSHL